MSSIRARCRRSVDEVVTLGVVVGRVGAHRGVEGWCFRAWMGSTPTRCARIR